MKTKLLILCIAIMILSLSCKEKTNNGKVESYSPNHSELSWAEKNKQVFYGYSSSNLTLRDYFAAQYVAQRWSAEDTPIDGGYDIIADRAYRYADEMLKRRKR